MNQEIIEKYLMLVEGKRLGKDPRLESYQLKQFIREIQQTRPIRETPLWKQIADKL